MVYIINNSIINNNNINNNNNIDNNNNRLLDDRFQLYVLTIDGNGFLWH